MSGGGIGFTVGSVKETTENTSANVRHAASTVGSLQGDTNIIAQRKYSQNGSIVSSPEGAVVLSLNKSMSKRRRSVRQRP